MPVGDRQDPFRGYNFRVELDGITRAGFHEASGLDSDQAPIEYREGTDPLTPRKLPGLVKYSNISLKWGIAQDTELWDWRQQAMDGKVTRKNGSVVLMNDAGDEVRRWNFRDGWPTKWTGPTFNATGTDVAIETLDIAHEGLSKP
jgi:phage tail-like protein